jgi:cellulose synthase/poly-beta-1,6-N-acetylglucosamine synthase-like glycosyltransferase
MSLAVTVFWISLLYTAYIIVIYPVILNYWARLFARKINRAPLTPSVSFVIAAHNGDAFLTDKLNSILFLDYPQSQIQTIVVNDGSTDRTEEIARSFGERVLLVNSAKVGKSAALNLGLARASGEIIVLTDVRQRLAPESLRLLMENFADPKVGTASAELQIQSGNTNEEADTGAYWKYERWIRLNLSSIDSIFGASGSYYAVRRELAVPIPANILVDDMYLPLHAFFRGYRLVVDRRAKMYDYPTKLSAEFGRKVRTLAGNYQILSHYPQLLGPRNRLWLHFASYKLGRLFLPFALLCAAVSSLLAGGTLAIFSALAQLAVYAAAFLDPKISPKSSLKRLTSPIRTFVVMMLATLCAISIWFVPPERLWKPTYVSRRDAPAQ